MLKDGIIIGERYEIVSRVGSGGMADVYKAMDHKLNRMVAVKILKAEFRQDTTFIAKFRKEAQSAAGLTHANVVNVYDVGEDRGLYYIVMELVEGITLKNYIMKKGKLSVKEATSIAIQVSLGLEAAHNQGIIHRDVKPQNIIISTDGKVKLSDFGIAKATNSNTITANVMGSVHYSSPEQVRGGFSDAKSDIYSLGITMYEMVTGRVPFDGDTTVSIAIKHLQEEIIPPSRYTSDLPYALEQIILKCTQKNPDRRYANMGELIDDLKKSLMDPQGNFVKIAPVMAGTSAGAAAATAAATSYSTGSGKAVAEEKVKIEKARLERAKAALTRKKAEEEIDLDDLDEEPKVRKYKPEIKKRPRTVEDEDAVSSRLEKGITIGAFLIGAVIVVILIVIVGNLTGLFGGSSGQSPRPGSGSETSAPVTIIPTEDEAGSMVEVPDFIGKTLEEAQELASQYGLSVKQSGTQNSDNYAAGQIVYQETLKGTMIKSGSTINVVVSAGGTNVIIPEGLVGAAQTDVENTLASLGLTAQATLQASEVEVGRVISISPTEGSSVTPGSVVYIYVSMGADGASAGQAAPQYTGDPSVAAPVGGMNAEVYGNSGIYTTFAIYEPYSYPGDTLTVQFVQNGIATIVFQAADDPWPDNSEPLVLTIFGAPGSTSGILQVLDYANNVIDVYEVMF